MVLYCVVAIAALAFVAALPLPKDEIPRYNDGNQTVLKVNGGDLGNPPNAPMNGADPIPSTVKSQELSPEAIIGICVGVPAIIVPIAIALITYYVGPKPRGPGEDTNNERTNQQQSIVSAPAPPEESMDNHRLMLAHPPRSSTFPLTPRHSVALTDLPTLAELSANTTIGNPSITESYQGKSSHVG